MPDRSALPLLKSGAASVGLDLDTEQLKLFGLLVEELLVWMAQRSAPSLNPRRL